jgi:hypothetical protein
MANVLTYNQIIQILVDIKDRHPNIETFVLGETFDLNDNITYPILQVYPDTVNMPINDWGLYSVKEISLICKVLDRVINDSKANEQDTHSDCLQVATDIINELNQNPYFLNSNSQLVGDINLEPLREFTDDYTAGWEFRLTFRLINLNTFCGLPFSNIPGFSASGPISTGYSASIQYMPTGGGVFTGSITGTCGTFSCFNATDLSGNTIYLSGVSLVDTFLGINSAISSATTAVQNGLNTYTGGTILSPTINISAATLSYLKTDTISGNSVPLNQILLNDGYSGITITSPEYLYLYKGNAQLYIDGSQTYLSYGNGLNTASFYGDSNELNLTYSNGLNNTSAILGVNGINLNGNIFTPQDKYIFIGGQGAGITNSSFIVDPNHILFFTNSAFTNSIISLKDGQNVWSDLTANGSIQLNVGSNSVALNRTSDSLDLYGGTGGTVSWSNTLFKQFINIQSATTDNTLTDIFVRASNGDVSIRNVVSIITGATSAITNTFIQNGINTYTGGTQSAPTINISALTINTLTASGVTSLQATTATTVSASTIQVGGFSSYTNSVSGISFFHTSGGTPIMNVNTLNGRVGINSTAGTAMLSVGGNISAGSSIVAGSVGGYYISSNVILQQGPLGYNNNSMVFGNPSTAASNTVFVPVPFGIATSGNTLRNLFTISQSNAGYGTIAATSGITTITGTATSFLTQFNPGDTVRVSGVYYTIASIQNDTLLTLTTTAATTQAASVYVTSTIGERFTIGANGNVRSSSNSISGFTVVNQSGGTPVFNVDTKNLVNSATTISLTGRLYNAINPIQITSATTINWATNNVFDYTLTAATTFSFSNIVAGQTLIIAVRQPYSGTTGFNYSFSGATVFWPAGTTPTATTTTGKTDIYTFVSLSAGTVYGSAQLNF